MSNRNRADFRGWRRAYLTVGACIALLFIGAMLERLGAPPVVIVTLVVACLIAMTLAAAWTGGTMSVERYSRAAIHSTSGLGLWIAADATVTACLLAFAAALALAPAPTLPAIAGIVGCLAAMILFGPAIRASGASTVPAFLEQRCGKVAVGMVASIAAAALCLLLALALFEAATRAMSSVIGLERFQAAGLLAAFLCLVGIVGGMRSVARVQPLHLIVLFFTGAATAGWLGIFDVATVATLPGWSDVMPAIGDAHIARDLMSAACIAIAMSAMPHMLVRLATPGEPRDLRGIAGSATLSALSMAAVLAVAAATFPHFFLSAGAQAGPASTSLPVALAAFTGAACLSLLVGAATSLLLAASATLSQDLYRGLFDRRITAGKALFLSRISFLLTAAGAALLVSNGELDLATLIRPALTLAAAALFPALVLAVFVPGSTGLGVTAALLVGGVFAGHDMAAVTGGARNLLPEGTPIVMLALPVSFATAIVVSVLGQWRANRSVARSADETLATGDRSPG